MEEETRLNKMLQCQSHKRIEDKSENVLPLIPKKWQNISWFQIRPFCPKMFLFVRKIRDWQSSPLRMNFFADYGVKASFEF